MADFNFVVNTDIDRMRAGIAPNMHRAFDKGVRKGLTAFTILVKMKLASNLASYGLGSLISQIVVIKVDEGLIVRVGEGKDDYAMFVEYGTGIVGESFPHPAAEKQDWDYDTEQHGDEGWWYPSNKDDPNPTKYVNKEGLWWAWTAGQASRPFMYETWLWARQSFNNTMTKHIAKELEREFKKLKVGF